MENDRHDGRNHKGSKRPRQEQLTNVKLTREQVVEIVPFRNQGEKDSSVARRFRGASRLAGKRKHRHRWRHIIAFGTLRAVPYVVLITILLLSSPASAWNAKTIALFASGWASGLAAHETGHYAVGAQSGASVEYEGMNQGSPSLWFEGDRTSVRNTAAGGFMVQVTSTELILEQENRGAFQLGWVCYNIANAFSYSFLDQVTPNGHGDLATMNDHGVESDAAGAVLVAHAAWSAYRLAGGQDGGATPWLEVEPGGNSIAFGFMWQF